jgi:hypothetical protein
MLECKNWVCLLTRLEEQGAKRCSCYGGALRDREDNSLPFGHMARGWKLDGRVGLRMTALFRWIA